MHDRSQAPEDLGDVRYVKRISIGTINPKTPLTEEQLNAQGETLNKCLSAPPKGRIIGKDRTFAVFQVGEHQVVMEMTTYLVGWKRKPNWILE